jgi:hypothetical protein
MLAGKLHVVVRGMDGYTLWHGTVNMSTMVFSGWTIIDGATQSSPILTASESRNEVYLVVRGLNNVIYYDTWTETGWTGWTGLSTGATIDGPGATVTGNTLYMVVRGMDSYALWHGMVDLTNGSLATWTLLSGSTPSPPTVTS